MKSRINYFLLALILLTHCTETKKQQEETKEPKTSRDQLFGAWEVSYLYNDSIPSSIIAIITDNYISKVAFSTDPNMFHWTAGGKWELNKDDLFVIKYEYNTEDTSKVNQTDYLSVNLSGDSLYLGQDNVVWKRLDDGLPGKLANAWLITGRMRDGKMTERKPGVRKTMKILSGTRFQWIAYNTQTAEFYGTGGGIYSTVDGIYTENIDVFSRDSSRVGASLNFNYRLENGLWHHSGLSSRGDSIYEVWTPRNQIE